MDAIHLTVYRGGSLLVDLIKIGGKTMQAKRIIPCLDTINGRVVKGVNFVNIKDVGDPVEYAVEYGRQGADELVVLDITATVEDRSSMAEVVKKTAAKAVMPLTFGGGIRTVEDFRKLFEAGADKISVNSAAVKNPSLIKEAAEAFGSERIVLAIDAKQVGIDEATGREKYNVLVSGGGVDTGIDLISWAKEGEKHGAGEILLTSLDRDGTKAGFDLPMLKAVCDAVDIPVVASGGGGDLDSFVELFQKTDADAALAASIFHFGEYTVGDVKAALRANGIPVL